MQKSGYTAIATSVGIRGLKKLELIETYEESDYNGNEFLACKLTDSGENWILSNQDKLEFKIKQNEETVDNKVTEADDLPF